MAVTVTPTQPSASVSPIFAGSYGPAGSGVTVGVSTVGSNKRIKLTNLTLSGTYETGGFTLTPSAFGLSEVHGVATVCDATSFGSAVPRLVDAGSSPTIGLFEADGVEVADDASVADHSYTVLLFGI